MQQSLIHVRLGKELKENMQSLIDSGLFSNQAEVVREALRRIVMEYGRRVALANLPKQRGMLKGKGKGLTREMREKIGREFTATKSEEISRRYGFD